MTLTVSELLQPFMDEVSFDDPIMQEEIFGPVLPVLTYDCLDEAISRINSMPHPLALYILQKTGKPQKKATKSCSFGGGCINDVVIHLATSQMGFGGFEKAEWVPITAKQASRLFTHYKKYSGQKKPGWIFLSAISPTSSEKLLKLFSQIKSNIPVIIPVPQESCRFFLYFLFFFVSGHCKLCLSQKGQGTENYDHILFLSLFHSLPHCGPDTFRRLHRGIYFFYFSL